MAKKEKLFKSSVGGFKKSEVIEYIEDVNRRAKLEKERYDFEIARLSEENGRLSEAGERLNAAEEKAKTLEDEKNMLSSDVENQKEVILLLENEKKELEEKLSGLERDCLTYKEKARQFDDDRNMAGGILERAKKEAESIVEQAKEKASEQARLIKEQSDKELEENIRKVKYLYKRRDELLLAFEKVKNAAGGFYDNVASTLQDDNKGE